MWYYAYCRGHSWFFEMPDGATEVEVREYIDDYAERNYIEGSIEWWSISKPPKNLIEDRMQSAQERIIALKADIERYSKMVTVSIPPSVEGGDKTVQKALEHRDEEDVIKSLHDAGLPITSNELYKWKSHSFKDINGNMHTSSKEFAPHPSIRDTVLRAVRKVKIRCSLRFYRNEQGEEVEETLNPVTGVKIEKVYNTVKKVKRITKSKVKVGSR